MTQTDQAPYLSNVRITTYIVKFHVEDINWLDMLEMKTYVSHTFTKPFMNSFYQQNNKISTSTSI